MKLFRKSLFAMLLATLLFPANSFSQGKDTFTHLKWISIEDSYLEQINFGYSSSTFTLINKSCNTLSKASPFYDEENADEQILIGSYKNKEMKKEVYILFSPGPSADPYFMIKDSNGKELWGNIADEMCINDNGVIYTAGHTDKMFNIREKWILKNNKVSKVKQPFLYVGIKDKTLKAVKLYSDKSAKKIIATIPAGYEIEVLLAEDQQEDMIRHYLVRTKFGLVGWLILTDKETYEMPVLRELRYWGD